MVITDHERALFAGCSALCSRAVDSGHCLTWCTRGFDGVRGGGRYFFIILINSPSNCFEPYFLGCSG